MIISFQKNQDQNYNYQWHGYTSMCFSKNYVQENVGRTKYLENY